MVTAETALMLAHLHAEREHTKKLIRSRALFTFTGRPRFPCPVGLHTVEESTE